MLAQRHYHPFGLAHPWPAAHLSWNHLALALLDMEEPSINFSQTHDMFIQLNTGHLILKDTVRDDIKNFTEILRLYQLVSLGQLGELPRQKEIIFDKQGFYHEVTLTVTNDCIVLQRLSTVPLSPVSSIYSNCSLPDLPIPPEEPLSTQCVIPIAELNPPGFAYDSDARSLGLG
ncbi:hypothetical protein TURU_017478 [Turdus rufiventris]|nr:hypothetical protein TURU_017478 [Turdus rufiventris]